MNESRNGFRLGIVGGCLSHQAGIPLSKLYQRRLATALRDESGIELQIRIVREFKRPYHERLDALLADEQLDGVLLHMRVSTARKSSILSRHSSGGVARYYLHPFLFNRRKVGWASVEVDDFAGAMCVVSRKVSDAGAEEHHVPRTGAGGFRFADLNVILGHLVGLDDWAIRDEMELLRIFAEACQRRGLPFMVLGPSAVGGVAHVNRFSENLNRRLAASAATLGVPDRSINRTVDEQGQETLLPDGYHLSEQGHRFVANRLRLAMTPWMKQILATRPAG